MRLTAAQFASFVLWLLVIVRPGDLPDPFRLGISLSLTVLCLAMAAAVWLPDLAARRWPSTSLGPVLGIYIALVIITSAWALHRPPTFATEPGAMLHADLQLVGNIGVFYATVVLARKIPRLAEGILLLLIASIALLQLMAFAYHAGQGLQTRLTVYPVPAGWSGYPELGVLAVVQFGLLVAGLQAVSSLPMFLGIAGLIIINLIELVFLYSRSSSLTVGLILLAAACAATSRRHVGRLLGIGGVVAVVGAVLLVANPAFRYLAETTVGMKAAPGARIDVSVANAASPDMRLDIWRKTLRMIADFPATGVGLGNFQEVFEAEYNPDLNADSRRGVHAHNLWLQQFAELGVLGGVFYLVLWVTIVGICWRSARERPAFVSVGLLLSVVAILGSNVTTNVFFLTGGASGRLQSLTWMVFGLVAAARSKDPAEARRHVVS